MGELVDQIGELEHGKLPGVSTDLNHINVRFFDENGEDLGYLSIFRALEAFTGDVYIWHECGPEDPETGEGSCDLDLRDAFRLSLQSH
jgi:hypothetical protein